LIEGAEPARTEAAEKAASEDDFIAAAPPPEPKPVAENAGAETRQWLAVPEPTNGASAAEVRRSRTRKRAPKPKPKATKTTGSAKPGTAETDKAKELVRNQREEISELGKRIRELQTQLRVQARDAKSEISEALEERDSLRQRVEELTSELADAKKRGAAKTTRRSTSTAASDRKQKAGSQPKAKARAKAQPKPKAREKAPPKAPARRAAKSKNGQLDLNAATFEELRGLGLSVTQSARVIAYRDVRGGYRSLDELDEVPGLSQETRGEIRAQLQL
jgi:DNA uptake protein ComE-like DNA-binding protein